MSKNYIVQLKAELEFLAPENKELQLEVSKSKKDYSIGATVIIAIIVVIIIMGLFLLGCYVLV